MILIILIIIGCTKDESCDNCTGSNQPPTAAAGLDQEITLPNNSVSLDGSGSKDSDGAVSAWLWTKISGPDAFDIVSPTTAKTVVKDLIGGIYQFELNVTDDVGLTAKDTVKVSVIGSSYTNYPPVANAGPDQYITLPSNSTILDGSGSIDDHFITYYEWYKISGPSSFNIVNAFTSQTELTDLVEGVYEFGLLVSDRDDLESIDTVQITVVSASPPCTNCKIVFVSNRDGNNEIYKCNLDGSNITRLTNNPAAEGQPTWSPDGARIAFIRSNTSYGAGDLFIMTADGSNVTQVTFNKHVMYPAWSPDNIRIAFTEVVSMNITSMINLVSGEISLLPVEGASVIPCPSWSPDGTKIAFDSDWYAWDFISDIFTISPNGTERNILTSTFFNDYDYWRPAWSPDGMRLSVTIYSMNSRGSDPSSIGLMNADGSGLTIIKTGIALEPFNVTRTSWSSDGTQIIYTENKTIKWVATDGSASGELITNAWDADWQH